ncbi:MAG: MFS transporter [Deltaproteobacteria bacterium]|nr:MFS transporter [Candidatus Anaeroferrophillacea bacterium]
MTARRRRYRWLIFALLALGYLLVYFHRLCPAVLALDLMRDLRATGALTGMLGAAYFYPYAIMQLPAGLLSDSWGPRKTITLFFLVAVAGSVLLGFATTVSMAILGRTLVGIGVAMLFVPTMKILAEWFLISEFAAMTGILMAMGGVGSLVAATPLVWISNLIGWRSSFLVVGGFTLLLAILVWVFVRNRPADFGWPSPHPETGGGNRAKIGLGTAVKMVLTRPAFWPLAVWFFFDCGIFFSFGGLWGGPYLMQVYGLTKAEAGRMLSMVAVGMVIGSPLLSWLSDRVFGGRKPVLLLAVTVLVAATGVLAFATAAIPRPAMYLLIFLLSVFSSAVVVIGFTANKELFPVQIAGTATGLVNLFPFAGGAVFQPLLGWILERHGKVGDAFTLAGYEAAFRILFIAALIAAAAAFLSRETIKSHV